MKHNKVTILQLIMCTVLTTCTRSTKTGGGLVF